MNSPTTVSDYTARVDVMLDGELFEVEFYFTTYHDVGSYGGWRPVFGPMTLAEDGTPIDEGTVTAAYDGDLEQAVMDAHTTDCADRY